MRIVDGLDLSNQQLKNMADGSASTDAVTLQQLHAFVRGLTWHPAIRAASTGNVNLASPGASLDGVTLNNNDRILLKNQTDATQNGIYVWTGATTALTRASDGVDGELAEGSALLATEGTVNADTAWVLATDAPFTVGTTALTFNQFGGSTIYTAGNGISVVGMAISVQAVSGGGILVQAGGVSIDYSKVATKYSANVGDGTATSYQVMHGLNNPDVICQLKEVATKNTVGITFTTVDANTTAISFPTAPTAGQYRFTAIG